MRVLVITSIFPNAAEPSKGTFNRQTVEHLAATCEVQVVAPLPWSPLDPGSSNIQRQERIGDITVHHPHFYFTPKIGRALYGFLFYVSLYKFIKNLSNHFSFDIIYALWAYPDGFGSFLVARSLNKPIVIQGLGSDINLFTKHYIRKKLITYALKRSNKVISVSHDLKGRMVELGVPESNIAVIPNGINGDFFHPIDRQEARRKLKLPPDTPIVLYVGNFYPVKGVKYLIEAMNQVTGACILYLVGDGPEKSRLMESARRSGSTNSVVFVQRQKHDQIPLWMNACDIFCLPSLNEGCPNVILEAFACNKYVIASRTGGIPELITSNNYGSMFTPGNSKEIAQAIDLALHDLPQMQISHTLRSWKTVANEICKLLNDQLPIEGK